MPTYYDSQNQPYILTNSLGRGGEGTVYAVDENPQIVAKIYHERISFEKIQKLRWMAVNHDEQLLKFAAWVIDVLTDSPNGKVVGFLMPSVRAKEIHELYSLKSRRVYFPDATWHFLIHTATNLARAFHSLHKKDHVIGDVNHGNCVVLADGTVKLIDCDSYSIKTNDKRYPCEVGVATHLPPELQGVKLRNVERQLKHDNFGLAVIIFQLLFLGRHPFAGNYLGGEDKSIEDAIRGHFFAYGRDAKQKMIEQPPGSLSLSAVSPRVANLFERAFTKDFIRPEPRDWIEALEDLADNLEQCVLHPGHLYYEKNLVCPWCEIESQTGLTVFPFIINDSKLSAKYKKTFDAEMVENLISSFNLKHNLSVELTKDIALKNLKSTAPITKKVSNTNTHKIVLLAVYVGAFLILYNMVPGVCAFGISAVTAAVLFSAFKSPTSNHNQIFSKELYGLAEKESEWNKLENDWLKVTKDSDVAKDLNLIKEKLTIYEKSNNSDEPIGQSAERIDKSQIENEISNLLVSLRSGSARLRAKQKELLAKSEKLIPELLQAERNVNILNKSFPFEIYLVIATVLLPFSTFIFSPQATEPSYYVSSNEPTKPYPTPILPPKQTYNYAQVPNADITNAEITQLSYAKRTEIINNLVNAAYAYQLDKDLKKAEDTLYFAERFDSENLNLLNSFGDIFYGQRKYKKSLEYYNRAKEIDETDEVNFKIGLNYLGLKDYEKAKNVFIKLTQFRNVKSIYFFNLGQSYFGLKSYSDAANAYLQALYIDSGDIETIYQLGITYNKLGDKNGVKGMYQKLLEINTYRATEFKKAVGKSVNLDMPPDIIRSKPAPVVEGDHDEPPPPIKKPIPK